MAKIKMLFIFDTNYPLRAKPLKKSNENIKTTLLLVNMLLALADKGDNDRDDAGCGILYGIIRDSAYRIKKAAESEKAMHEKTGKWF